MTAVGLVYQICGMSNCLFTICVCVCVCVCVCHRRLHDLLKQLYRRTNQGQEPGVVTSLGFGVLSAFTGQLVAFPLETVARRLQVYQGPGGLPTMLRTMVQNGGPAVFYRWACLQSLQC